LDILFLRLELEKYHLLPGIGKSLNFKIKMLLSEFKWFEHIFNQSLTKFQCIKSSILKTYHVSPLFLRGVKFNFDELQPNFLWVIIDPHRAQKGCETNVSRREIFRFFPPRFELRTLGFLVRALTTDLRCRGAAAKKN